jgi:hypothetical protein
MADEHLTISDGTQVIHDPQLLKSLKLPYALGSKLDKAKFMLRPNADFWETRVWLMRNGLRSKTISTSGKHSLLVATVPFYILRHTWYDMATHKSVTMDGYEMLLSDNGMNVTAFVIWCKELEEFFVANQHVKACEYFDVPIPLLVPFTEAPLF